MTGSRRYRERRYKHLPAPKFESFSTTGDPDRPWLEHGEPDDSDAPEAGWDEWGPDPVFEDNEGWWFWDETWSNRFGPYESEEIAHERCYDYARAL